MLLERTEEIIRDNRSDVLALAHALETHKTLSGEDIVAVLEHTRGPLVDGTPYGDERFLAELADYASPRPGRTGITAWNSWPCAGAAPPPPWAAGVTGPIRRGSTGITGSDPS